MTRDSGVLPSDLICIFPELYFLIIRTGSNDVLRGMETDPIASSFMSIQHFNALNLYSNERAHIFSLSQFLSQHWEIPYSDSGVECSWHYKIFLMMKLSTHNIMTMSGDDVNTGSALIIPNAHSLIITSRQDPGQLMMEKCRSDVIYMPFKSEHTSFLLVVPYFYQAIVSARYEERQLWMKIDSTWRSLMSLNNIIARTSNLATHIFML